MAFGEDRLFLLGFFLSEEIGGEDAAVIALFRGEKVVSHSI